MLAYLRAVWGYRYFWTSLVRIDLRARYRGSVLGVGWSLLQPIAMTLILTLVFCNLFNRDPREYIPYLMTGLVCWSFIVNNSLHGCRCFFQAESYIRQHSLPMAIYPLRTMLTNAFHFSLGLLLAISFATVLVGVPSPRALLTLMPSVVLLCLLGWSLAILFGLITVRFRDTTHLAEVGFQALFYLTPIMYRPTLFQQTGVLGKIINHNPVLPFLNLLREPIIDHQVPSPATYAAAAAVVLAVGGLATLLLWRQERQIIFHL